VLTATQSHIDEKFIQELKSRSEEAFAKLYDNYSGALYGILFRMLGKQEIAQDALQESFVKIWKNIESYDRTKGTVFTWMLNISRNHAIDVMRSKNMRQKIQSIDKSVGVVNNQISTKTNEDHFLIKELVENLKPEHRQMIEMAFYKGYTQEELAEELNMPLGTVKTRARAALAQLRKYFDK
jgi:RNA polymerase sigma-70 factor (ECF subfamily)